jgi:hypothetical protein
MILTIILLLLFFLTFCFIIISFLLFFHFIIFCFITFFILLFIIFYSYIFNIFIIFRYLNWQEYQNLVALIPNELLTKEEEKKIVQEYNERIIDLNNHPLIIEGK